MSDSERITVTRMLPLVRERLKRLDEVSEAVRFLFQDIINYKIEDLIPKKLDAATTVTLLVAGREILEGLDTMGDEEVEEAFRAKAEELGAKLGSMLMPLRVAVTGTTASPPLFPSIRLLGLPKTLSRVDRVITLLQEHVRG